MKLEDLESLKLAIDTGNIGYYHGDFTQAFVDVVDELLEIKSAAETYNDKVDTIKDELVEKVEELQELTKSLEELVVNQV